MANLPWKTWVCDDGISLFEGRTQKEEVRDRTPPDFLAPEMGEWRRGGGFDGAKKKETRVANVI